jgi:hypothetical protein
MGNLGRLRAQPIELPLPGLGPLWIPALRPRRQVERLVEVVVHDAAAAGGSARAPLFSRRDRAAMIAPARLRLPTDRQNQ